MPQYINDINLPYPIYKAICNDPYSKGNAHYSVTQLFDGAKKIYGDKLAAIKGGSINVSDLLAMFDGSMFHDGVEHRLTNDPEFITEQRLQLKVMVNGQEIIISGAFDCYCLTDRCLYDYKTTKPDGWKLRAKKMPAYSQQVNIYKLMMKLNGIADPLSLAIIFCIKGWNYIDSLSYGYSKTQYPVEKIEIMDQETLIQLIKEKVTLLEQYKTTPYELIPYCTPEQKWSDSPFWKVCLLDKNGNIPPKSRAVPKGAFETEEAAKDFLKVKGPKYYIHKQEGSPKRCLKYCQAGKHGICPYPKEWYENKNKTEITEETLLDE